MTLAGTPLPAGTLLVTNGGASNDRIIALNPVTGEQLAVLDLGQNLDPDAGAFHPGTGELLHQQRLQAARAAREEMLRTA